MEEIKRISDVIKDEAFEGVEKVETKNLIDKEIVLRGFAERSGQTGAFYVVLADLDGRQVSFATGGEVVMHKIKSLLANYKVERNVDGCFMLPEPIVATIVERTSKAGKVYHNLE